MPAPSLPEPTELQTYSDQPDQTEAWIRLLLVMAVPVLLLLVEISLTR